MKNTDKISLLGGIRAICKIDNDLWGALIAMNALVRISTDLWEMEIVANFPDEAMDTRYLFTSAVYKDGKIVFAPRMAKNIVIFDIVEKKFLSIKIDEKMLTGGLNYNAVGKFENTFLYGNHVYMLGYAAAVLLKMSLDDYSISYIKEPFDILDRKIKDYSVNEAYFRGCIMQKNTVMTICPHTNTILKYNLQNDTYEMIDINMNKELYAVFEYKNGYLVGTGKSKELFLSAKNGECKRITEIEEFAIRDLFCNGDKVFCISMNKNVNGTLLIYDLANDVVQIIDEIKDGIAGICVDNKSIYAINFLLGIVYEINCFDWKVKEHILKYEGATNDFLKKNIRINLLETQISLEDFLEKVLQ